MHRTNYNAPTSFWGNLSGLLESSATSLMMLLLIPALVAVALLLPPVSLLERIQSLTYTEVDERGATIVDPDQTTVTFPGEYVKTPFRASINSIPRVRFLNGEAGEVWRQAAMALPDTLIPRSPLYEIDLRGSAPTGAVIQIPIPNDSEPYETLDVYTWTGREWEHLPNLVLGEQLESQVIGEVPGNFMVMQTGATLPQVAANIGLADALPANAENAVVSVMVAGLYLRGDGALDGQLRAVPQGNYEIVPVLRNWHEGEIPRVDLLNNMVIDPGLMENQINAVTDLLVTNSYPGVVIDYRGVDATPQARADFVRFIQLLAERLHTPDLGKQLAVRVESPTQISAQDWNTAGYDWQALGDVVDTLIVPAPVDPRAYQPGGEMEALLAWATDQVDRSKLQIELPGRSVERSGNYWLLKGYQEALQPLVGQIQAEGGDAPGEPIQVTLDNPRILNRLTYNEATATYSYSYLDDQGFERTVYLENAGSFAHKLSLLEKYHVTQVTVRDLDKGDVDPGLWEITRQFQEGVLTAPELSSISVAYTIKNQDGSVLVQDVRPLDSPGYSFAAPSSASGLQVEAQLIENSRPVGLANSIALALTEPEPAEPTPAPTPDYVRLSSGQIVNVRQGPSTQYNILGQIQPGAVYRILGKNQSADWWQLDLDGQVGWTIGSLVDAAGDVDSVEVITDIPTPPEPVAVAAAAPAEAPAQEQEQRQEVESAPAPAAVAAPAPSGGGSFGYGVQAHMVHNDQAGKVMQMTTGMGFNWVKQQIEWKVFEASPGQIDWGSMEGIINAANGAGVNLLFSVVNAPAWAREPGHDANVGGPPADPQTFANFLGAVAGRYCGTSLKAIEVWNEQNLHYEWGNKPLNAAEYVQLLAPSYAAIKGACPSMKVISGALTPAGNNGNFAIDDMQYLEAMFQAGLNNYMDGIGAHPSGYNVPPSAGWQDACGAIQASGNSFNGACDSPHHSWSFRSTMEGYRNIAVNYGAGNKLIWPTEFGWAAGGAFDPRYAYANDNDYNEQAAWTVEAYQMMRNWGWVGPAILWNLNFRVVANGTEKAQWGIVDPSWGPLPVYNALRDMPK